MKLKNLKVGTSIFSLDFERPYLREKKPCATNYSRGHLPQTATNCHIAKKLCRFSAFERRLKLADPGPLSPIPSTPGDGSPRCVQLATEMITNRSGQKRARRRRAMCATLPLPMPLA